MKIEAVISFRASATEFVELSAIERFDDSSGFVSTIHVSSGKFVCAGRQFYFDDLQLFSCTLAKCYREISGYAELRHRYEHDHVRFEFTKRGHVIVSGSLVDYGTPKQSFQFGFETDQTFIPHFLTTIDDAMISSR